MPHIRLFASFLLILLTGLVPAVAQDGGLFAPRVLVNGRAITNWEVEQRVRFLQLLRAPGDLQEVALEGLIEDRLRLDAASIVGLRLSDEQVIAGMTEFAARANLDLEQFIAAITGDGVDQRTFRDFVEAGIVWREVVRGLFGPRAQISEAEIDRALALTRQAGAARVLLSEIILRADTPAFQEESQALAERLQQSIETPGAFAAAARRYSVSPSAGRGGRIDWLDLANLPPALASQVLALGPGEVSDPIPVTNAIALFQLRAIEENDVTEAETLAVEYARFYVPSGSVSEAEKVRARVDSCDDMYGVALKKPEEQLTFTSSTVGELDGDIALTLAKLDANETALFGQGIGFSVVMLCGRTPELNADVDRGTVRQQLFNQRLNAYAEGYMAELRAEAIIRTP